MVMSCVPTYLSMYAGCAAIGEAISLGMPKGRRCMIEVATSVAVPPPMPMMPCTRPWATSSSTIAAAPRIWLLVAASRSERHFSRTTSIGKPPRAAMSSVRMSPGNGGGSSMLKSSSIASRPRSAMSCLTKTMSSPRVSRLQTMTMPFLSVIFLLALDCATGRRTCRQPHSLAAFALLRFRPRQAVDHAGHGACAGKAVLVAAVRDLLQHAAVHEDLARLVLPLIRGAGVEDDPAGDVARLDRQARIERRRAAAVDDLGRPFGVEARGQRPPDAIPVVGLDIVVDHDYALDAVVPGG